MTEQQIRAAARQAEQSYWAQEFNKSAELFEYHCRAIQYAALRFALRRKNG